jgi:hypothetical protein
LKRKLILVTMYFSTQSYLTLATPRCLFVDMPKAAVRSSSDVPEMRSG